MLIRKYLHRFRIENANIAINTIRLSWKKIILDIPHLFLAHVLLSTKLISLFYCLSTQSWWILWLNMHPVVQNFFFEVHKTYQKAKTYIASMLLRNFLLNCIDLISGISLFNLSLLQELQFCNMYSIINRKVEKRFRRITKVSMIQFYIHTSRPLFQCPVRFLKPHL